MCWNNKHKTIEYSKHFMTRVWTIGADVATMVRCIHIHFSMFCNPTVHSQGVTYRSRSCVWSHSLLVRDPHMVTSWTQGASPDRRRDKPGGRWKVRDFILRWLIHGEFSRLIDIRRCVPTGSFFVDTLNCRFHHAIFVQLHLLIKVLWKLAGLLLK